MRFNCNGTSWSHRVWFEGKGVSTSRVSPPGPLSLSRANLVRVVSPRGEHHTPALSRLDELVGARAVEAKVSPFEATPCEHTPLSPLQLGLWEKTQLVATPPGRVRRVGEHRVANYLRSKRQTLATHLWS